MFLIEFFSWMEQRSSRRWKGRRSKYSAVIYFYAINTKVALCLLPIPFPWLLFVVFVNCFFYCCHPFYPSLLYLVLPLPFLIFLSSTIYFPLHLFLHLSSFSTSPLPICGFGQKYPGKSIRCFGVSILVLLWYSS